MTLQLMRTCHVNGCPCGTTTISLHKGADSSHYQPMGDQLLKGAMQAKQALQKDEQVILTPVLLRLPTSSLSSWQT